MNIHRILTPVLRHFRPARMRLFESLLQPGATTRVLDVGGNPFNWQFANPRPRVTLLNLDFSALGETPPEFDVVIADGRRLPFASSSFDIVFCNSVIEHLGALEAQATLAKEIRRVGRAYFVQTPNRAFPVEPHFLAPGFQFLPIQARRALARNFTPWGWITRASAEEARRMVDEISLLNTPEMGKLFPDGEIVLEKFGGLNKSIVAIRR